MEKDKSILPAKFFCSFIAISLGAIYFFGRIGFSDQQFSLIVRAIGLLFFVLHFNIFVKSYFSPFILLLFCFLLGFVLPQFNLYFMPVILFAGFLSFLINLAFFLKNKGLKFVIFLIILSIVFAFWIAGNIWGSEYHNILFLEKMAIGKINRDVVFNPSISQMLKTYGIPSTGQDGTPYLSYHFASHFIFAILSGLFNVNLVFFYQLFYPLVFIPLLLYSLIVFVKTICQEQKIKIFFDIYFFIFLIVFFVGLLSEEILQQVALYRINIFVSESYQLSIIAFFVLLSLALRHYKSRIFIFSLPLCVFIFCFLKISTAFIVLMLFIYVFIRFKKYKDPLVIFSVVLSIVAFAFSYRLAVYNLFTVAASSNFIIYPLHYVLSRVSLNYLPLFFIIFYFWEITYIFIRLTFLKIRSVRELKHKLILNNIPDVEFLVVVSVIGFLPGAITKIGPAGDAFYFMDVQRWIAISLLLSRLDLAKLFFQKMYKIINESFLSIKAISLIIFIIPFLFLAINFYSSVKNLVKDNIYVRIQLIKNSSKYNAFRHEQILKKFNLFGIPTVLKYVIFQPSVSIKFNPKYQMLQTFLRLEQIPLVKKKTTAILIPLSNKAYWYIIPCRANGFIAPALSGMAVINGYPELGCNIFPSGNEVPDIKASSVQNAPKTQKEICQKASKLGFTQVLRIESFSYSTIEKISCGKK